MSFISLSFILFLIMDPIGNVASYQKVIGHLDDRKGQKVVLRELLFALIPMVLFYFIGDVLLDVLQISEVTVYFSSGLILFLFALRVLYPSPLGVRANLTKEDDPWIFPLSVPLIAGPSLLATIMLFGHQDSLSAAVIPATVIAWFISLVILMFFKKIYTLVGTGGVAALERLMGLLLVLIAIQRFMEGIRLFITLYG